MPASQSRSVKKASKSRSKAAPPKSMSSAKKSKAPIKTALVATKKESSEKLTRVKPSAKQPAENQESAALRSAHKLSQKWSSLYEKSKTIKPVAYKMSASYESKTPIQHKVLGWGYILSSHENRLEVLFEDGVRYLISNYKPTT